MKDIYMPNLLRIENYKLDDVPDGIELPYFLDFNLENDDDFNALITYQIANILEKTIIFERVYLDKIELPLFISCMAKKDLKATIKILNSGLISYIDIKDLRIAPLKFKLNSKGFVLTAYGHNIKSQKNIDEFVEFVTSFIKDKEIIKSITPSLKIVYNSRKTPSEEINVEKMVKDLDKLIKKGTFSKLGIGKNNHYFITNNNRNIYNLIGRFYRDNYISEKLGIYTYYFDDIIEALSIILNEKEFIYEKEFFAVSNINKLPDLKLMILEEKLSLDDIAKIIKNKNISNFRNWFFNSIETGDEIVKDFIEMLKIKEPIPLKIIRFLVPNISGFIPVYGTGISIGLDVIDTFLLDNKLNKSPCNFINDYTKIVNKSSKEITDKSNKKEIKIPVKKVIEIDNTLTGIEAELETRATLLSQLETQIDFNNDDSILTIYTIGEEISKDYLKYTVVMERYLHLCLTLTKKLSFYSFAILRKIEEMYLRTQKVDGVEFIKEYYFESYYNLTKEMEKKKQKMVQNPFMIKNDEKTHKEYLKYIVSKKLKLQE